MPPFEKDGQPKVVGVILWVLLVTGVYFSVPGTILGIVVQVDLRLYSNLELGDNWLENIRTINQHYFPIILILTMAGQYLFFAGLTLLLYPKLHGRPRVESLAIRMGSPLGLVLGLAAGVFIVPLASWLGEFWFWLFPPLRALVEIFGWTNLTTNDPATILFYVVAIGVTPALCEEILYRGYLQNTLQRKWSQRTSLLFSSVLFAFIHQNVYGLVALLAVSLFLGWIFQRYQNLATPIAFHFAYNTTIVLVAMTGLFPDLLNERDTFDWPVMVGSTLVWGLVVGAMVFSTRKTPHQAFP